MSALTNLRVLVTRPRGQSSILADLLAAEGANPILIPTIEIAPPASFAGVDAALATLRIYDWVIFTSANAVVALAARAKDLNLPLKANRIAAIGPATARAVEEAFEQPADLVPPEYVAESLAQALLPIAKGAAMLLVRAAVARETLPAALTAAGANVTIAEVYRNVIPSGSVAELKHLFETNPPDAITFTSASTAQNLHALLASAELTVPSRTVLASIGPVTSQAMRDLGLRPSMEAAESTIPGLVQAIAQHFARSGHRS